MSIVFEMELTDCVFGSGWLSSSRIVSFEKTESGAPPVQLEQTSSASHDRIDSALV